MVRRKSQRTGIYQKYLARQLGSLEAGVAEMNQFKAFLQDSYNSGGTRYAFLINEDIEDNRISMGNGIAKMLIAEGLWNIIPVVSGSDTLDTLAKAELLRNRIQPIQVHPISKDASVIEDKYHNQSVGGDPNTRFMGIFDQEMIYGTTSRKPGTSLPSMLQNEFGEDCLVTTNYWTARPGDVLTSGLGFGDLIEKSRFRGKPPVPGLLGKSGDIPKDTKRLYVANLDVLRRITQHYRRGRGTIEESIKLESQRLGHPDINYMLDKAYK